MSVSELPLQSQGSGEGLLPVTAEIEPPHVVAAESQSPRPLTGAVLLGAGLLLSFANFMVLLDTTIANVSVPNIAGGLGVSSNEGTWVITSYAVAEAITVPLTGWLAQRFGSVRTFVTAMVCFGLCSALCGLAPSLGVLVLFRVMQGLAGGPMIPLSQTLLLRVFPKPLAGQAMGLWAMTTVIAPIAGPILGGAICDNYNWPWVFYINVPFAVICAFFCWRLIKPFETSTKKSPVDVVGLIIMVTWIGALQIMLDKGEELDWFQSRTIVGLFIVAIVGLVAFVIWELTDANPVVNLRVLANRGYTIVLCLCFGAYFASVVILPLWLQTNLNYTATWAGYAVAPAGVFAIVVSPVVGRMIGKVDSRLLIFIGVLGLSFTMFWRSGFASNIDFAALVAPQFVQGMFVPLFFVPLFGLALSSLKPQDITGGAGLMSFARTMAGAFGTSLATTTWTNSARSSRVDLLNQFDTGRALDQLGAQAGMTAAQTLRQLDGLIQGESVMLATDQLFLVLGVLMVLAAFSIWLTPKPQISAEAAASGH